jgi:hypothetical protein
MPRPRIDYTVAYVINGTWVRQGDLSKKEAMDAAKGLRFHQGVPAFVYPSASLHLVTFV